MQAWGITSSLEDRRSPFRVRRTIAPGIARLLLRALERSDLSYTGGLSNGRRLLIQFCMARDETLSIHSLGLGQLLLRGTFCRDPRTP